MTTTTTTRTMNLKRRTSVLRFAAGDGAPPDGEYCIRGGICWPVIVDRQTARSEGFAVVAGRNLKSRATYILAQTPFVCIDHVQDEHGAIQFQGLSTWFIDAWASWFAEAFCWKQPFETNRRYLIQVLRSPMVQPKPRFIELEWDEDVAARAIVGEEEATGRLQYAFESPLHVAIMQFSVADPADRDRFPAVQALTCALHGLEAATPREKDNRC